MGRVKENKISGVSKMPFCTISTLDMSWNKTGSWRYLRPSFIERIPSCQAHCPTGSKIERWIKFLEEGKINEAWETAVLENPFPAITGRVCYHPCQEGCSRKEMGGSVGIQMLERVLSERAKGFKTEPLMERSKKKIAVIGSGPAGLSCAFNLTRLGHNVTVIDKKHKAGGMLQYAIPEYRLPKHILDNEIERLKEMGISFKLSHPIKDAVEMQFLLQEEFDAVFMATGAHKNRSLGLEEGKTSSVWPALDFLELASQGKPLPIGKKVIVIGGGNSAIDAARTALRMGAEATILYRRTKNEMPAFKEEIDEALKEGVAIEELLLPKKIVSDKNKFLELVCDRAVLGKPDESGRRSPEPKKDSETIFKADSLIYAVGEDIETTIIPSALSIKKGSLETELGCKTIWSSVFAGGDLIREPRTVVDAIASGKRAAIAIDCTFRGLEFDDILKGIQIPDSDTLRMEDYINLIKKEKRNEKTPPIKHTVVSFNELNPVYFQNNFPSAPPAKPVSERFNFNPLSEVYQTLDEENTKYEISRCFHCGRCIACDNCYIYCPDISVKNDGGTYEIDYDYCKGCGVCVTECPRAAMEITEEETVI